MRHSFFPQIQLGTKNIRDIKFDLTSRHELVPILMALQYLYVECRDLIDNALNLIKTDICKFENQKKGGAARHTGKF